MVRILLSERAFEVAGGDEQPRRDFVELDHMIEEPLAEPGVGPRSASVERCRLRTIQRVAYVIGELVRRQPRAENQLVAAGDRSRCLPLRSAVAPYRAPLNEAHTVAANVDRGDGC